MLPAQSDQSFRLAGLRPGSSPANFQFNTNKGDGHEQLVANLSTPHIQRLAVTPIHNCNRSQGSSPDTLSIASGDSQQSITFDSQERESNLSYQESPIPMGTTCFYVIGSHEITDPNKVISKTLDIWKCYFDSI